MIAVTHRLGGETFALASAGTFVNFLDVSFINVRTEITGKTVFYHYKPLISGEFLDEELVVEFYLDGNSMEFKQIDESAGFNRFSSLFYEAFEQNIDLDFEKVLFFDKTTRVSWGNYAPISVSEDSLKLTGASEKVITDLYGFSSVDQKLRAVRIEGIIGDRIKLSCDFEDDCPHQLFYNEDDVPKAVEYSEYWNPKSHAFTISKGGEQLKLFSF